MCRFRGVRRVLWLLAALTFVPAAGAATLPAYAPLDQPGPPLTVPVSKLTAALHCEASVAHAKVEPVLLNPATGVTPDENYSWNWEPALDKLGIPWCAYTAPFHTLGDIQTSGEYLVFAIRTMHALAGRKIAIMGHSQGGMSMRWALRFWPDTRAMVDDVIGFSGSNHGTTVLSAGGCAGGCPAADWQQTADSSFIHALNSGVETFPGISYTEIWTHTDEVVQPNGSAATASAALHTGGGMITDIATQQICPLDVFEHLTVGTVDPVAYALAVDALRNSPAHPADPARISKSVCAQATMPGVSPSLNTLAQVLAAVPTLASVTLGFTAGLTAGAPVLTAEPRLACYVTATCRGAAAPTLTLRILGRPRLARGHRARLRVVIRAEEGGSLVPVPGALVAFDGRSRPTSAAGVAVLTVRPRFPGRYALSARLHGCNGARATLRVAG
jgi:hypothetical protein